MRSRLVSNQDLLVRNDHAAITKELFTRPATARITRLQCTPIIPLEAYQLYTLTIPHHSLELGMVNGLSSWI
jgi:hypothetical protein